MKKKTILIFLHYYLPGFKGGGPIRSISDLIEFLKDEFNFLVITSDRDIGDKTPYENIRINEWNDYKNYKIFYVSKNSSLFTQYSLLIKVINDIEFDTYYLNSFFDFSFSIRILLLIKLKFIPKKKILLATRGDLGVAALKHKNLKKKQFLKFAKFLDLYKNIVFHLASAKELHEVKLVLGEKINYKIAIDIPNFNLPKVEKKHVKEKGKLKILFLSQISPIKNLKFAIEVLNEVKGDFIFDIYGPIRDEVYWEGCKAAINERIKNRVNYFGPVDYSKIHEIFPDYDLFFFPSLGESFGHVVFEALFFGCPLLLAQNNIWSKIFSIYAGWLINNNDNKENIVLIEKLVDMDFNNYNTFVTNALIYGRNVLTNTFKNNTIQLNLFD